MRYKTCELKKKSGVPGLFFSEIGASAVEAALLLALCTAITIVTLRSVGASVNNAFVSTSTTDAIHQAGFQPDVGLGGGSENGLEVPW